MVGAEFDVHGVTLRPSGLRPSTSGTFQSYNVSTPVLGLTKLPGSLGYSGWYTPLVQDDACSVHIELSDADATALKTLTVNGEEAPVVVQDNIVTIRTKVCNVRWELLR